MIRNYIYFIVLSCFSPLLLAISETAFLAQFINPGDLVFDVGANIGKKTKYYLQLGARVVAVEPQPGCCTILRNEFARSPVVVVSKGLSNNTGVLKLNICTDANAISTFSAEWQNAGRFHDHGYKWDQQVEVEVTTLDILIAQFGLPKFCKIDVENYEFEVLSGLKQAIPYLSFEFAIETLHNTRKCLDYLKALGYTKFNFAVGDEPGFVLPGWVSAQEVLQKIQYIDSTIKSAHWGSWGLWGDIYASY